MWSSKASCNSHHVFKKVYSKVKANFLRECQFQNVKSPLLFLCWWLLIHSANPKSRPVGIVVFAHVVRTSPLSNLAKQNNRKQCSLLAWLWVWPSGSLMTPVLFTNIFGNRQQIVLKSNMSYHHNPQARLECPWSLWNFRYVDLFRHGLERWNHQTNLQF